MREVCVKQEGMRQACDAFHAQVVRPLGEHGKPQPTELLRVGSETRPCAVTWARKKTLGEGGEATIALGVRMASG
jgi:hypothetical protein